MRGRVGRRNQVDVRAAGHRRGRGGHWRRGGSGGHGNRIGLRGGDRRRGRSAERAPGGAENSRTGLAADRGGVNLILRTDRQRRHFALWHLIQNEPIAVGRAGRGDADHQSAGFGAGDQVAFPVDGQRAHVGLVAFEEDGAFAVGRDFVDFALVAGGDEQIAGFVEDHRPDVLLLRIVEDGAFAGRIDAIDLAVGRGGGVDSVLRIYGKA